MGEKTFTSFNPYRNVKILIGSKSHFTFLEDHLDQDTLLGFILGLLLINVLVFIRFIWEKISKYRSHLYFRLASSLPGVIIFVASLLLTSIAIAIWLMPYIFGLWPQFGSDWSRIIVSTMLMVDLVFHLVAGTFTGLLELVIRWVKGTPRNVQGKL